MAARSFAVPVSSDFHQVAEIALTRVRASDDEAVAYAASHVPIFIQPYPTAEQAEAGGCRGCTYLGLWASDWPGFLGGPHGLIFLFEQGIRDRGATKDLLLDTIAVVEHEIGHALNRDHVLDALQKAKASGEWAGRPTVYG